MENLTLDQAELLFQLFLAQNGDKKISEFVKNYKHDLKICDLMVERQIDGTCCLSTSEWNFFAFGSVDMAGFHVWNFGRNGQYWKPYDIMKYISLEDKV